jgi:hypothetical protein
VPAERQVRVDPLLDRGHPELLQDGDLRLCEGLIHEVGQGRSAPQTECSAKLRRPLRGRRTCHLFEQASEPVRIDLPAVDRQNVTRRASLYDGGSFAGAPRGLQALAEGGHEAVECRDRRRGRRLAPQPIDQSVGRDDLVGPQDQERKQRPAAPAGQGHGPISVEDLQWPQNAELHQSPLACSLPTPPLIVGASGSTVSQPLAIH